MADDKQQPIVFKKIKKGGHGGHHGGSWKVAYADFVTAMMAFFLLLWVIGTASGAQRKAIADFFQNPSAVKGPGGASTSMIKLGTGYEMPRSGDVGKKRQDTDNPNSKLSRQSGEKGKGGTEGDVKFKAASEEKRETVRLEKLLEKLNEKVDQSQSLKPYKEHLLIELMPEGLRVQIVDKENRAMFPLGSAELKSYTRAILRDIAKTINQVDNRISITGHTDATPYRADRRDYSNWELSADRANAARRELIAGGMKKDKIGRVVGLADTVLYDKESPYHPINRRISIIIMKKDTDEDIVRSEGNTKADDVADSSSNTPQEPSGTEREPLTPWD